MTRVSAFSCTSLPGRAVAVAAAAFAVAAAGVFAVPSVAAAPQEGAASAGASPTPASSSSAPGTDIQRINQDLSDIDLLRPFLPLSLTRKQVDDIVAAMKETSAISTEVKRQDEEATRALAADIAKVRADALKGTLIPTAFDAKIAAAAKASDQRLAEAKQKAIKKLLTTLDATLTSSQKETVFEWEKQQLGGGYRVPAEYKSDPSKAPKEIVRALALVELIKYALLSDRTLTLLQQYKPADAPSAAAGAAAPAGTPAP